MCFLVITLLIMFTYETMSDAVIAVILCQYVV